MPSILIEMGFLTNPAEEDFLNSKDGKEYMASAIYRAIKKYIASTENIPLSELNKINEVTPNSEKETNNVVSKPEYDSIKGEKDTLDINYRIQILVSSAAIDLNPENFNSLEPITTKKANQFYKYYYGKANSYKEAQSLRDKAKSIGYNESFIVSFNGETKIDLQEALTLESKNKKE